MKTTIFLCALGLAVVGCTQRDSSTAALQKYYALKGEEMTATAQRVPQHNPKPGVTESLSTTNRPPTR